MIKVKNLTIEFENIIALNDFSFTFPSTQILGLVGPNGAGKSSLLRSLVGLIEDYEGEIYFFDKELRSNRKYIKRICGYAPEDAVLFPYLSGEEFLQLIGTIRYNSQKKIIEKDINFLLDLLNMAEKKDELIINYSHGMRQKLSIAAALMGEPQFIIIDESLNGLDPQALYSLKKHLLLLAKKGKTIILSSHILPLIKDWCDQIIIINNGELLKVFDREELVSEENKRQKSFEEIFISLIE